jgi:hypothetical protein
MASVYFLTKHFPDVSIYLSSIKVCLFYMEIKFYFFRLELFL